ncbi:TonB-dependent receptor [Flavobacterium sp. LC2016-01]|uniref:TonB-dependent receptor n=1 Tax=Flavobacterium sp. LC2016-01 TaxID=2675876 RepID=UPI0012BA9843|nr:TonB-dependent receptor [Flavobacterium sp. LC2016-01]MTH15029.1 TonB-dependent receptor plug domain-containing protein [Flavobacterium sp. LC2016-01]
MKKYFILYLFFLLPIILFSQEKNISIKYSNVTRKKAIETVEKNTSFHFYFEDQWLSDNELISGEFNNTSISIILDAIFNNTTINYVIDGNNIILSDGLLISNTITEDYFKNAANTNVNNTPKLQIVPIYNKQYLNDSKKDTDSIISLGKQSLISTSQSYTLSGYIKDRTSGKPEYNITVKVKDKDISTTSDENGYYSFRVPAGINIIETQSIKHGSKTKKIVLYSNGKVDFTLDENVNALKEVVIENKRSKNTTSAVAGLTSINIENIKNVPLILGERDIFKVATTLPGIKTAGEGSAGFNVRGGKDDQNLFLLDNASLYNPSHFLGFFSSVNPFTTKSADIYKGSIPAEFGGRLSSVFDIKSKNGNTEKVSGEAGIGPVMSNVTLEIPIVKGKSSLIFGGRASYSDWILKAIKDPELDNSQASFYDLLLKYNHQISAKDNLETSLYYSHDKYSINSDSIYKYSNQLATIKWDHDFNAKNKSSLIITNSQYKFNIDYDSQPQKSFDYGYKINETQLVFKMKYILNEKHAFNYGVSSKIYNVDPGFLEPTSGDSQIKNKTLEKEKALESALFFTENYKVNDKLLIDLGLRYSFYSALGPSTQNIYQDDLPKSERTVIDTKTYSSNESIKTYGGFEPRISARYFILPDLSIKASFDRTYQYMHLLSTNTTQSPMDVWKLSDLNTEPQSSNQFSLGLFKNIIEKSLELSIEGYYKRSKNILDYKVGAELFLNENIETELLQGEGKAYGVEFLIKKEKGNFNGWLSYTYSRALIKLDSRFDSEKINSGQYFPTNYDKPHDFSAILNYKFTKRYSLSTNFVYQTGRPVTFPIGSYDFAGENVTLYSNRNQYRIPDYYRLDIGLNFEGNHKIKKLAHSFWNLSVYNVLGRNNPYNVYFVTEDKKIKAYKTSIFSVPIPTITYNIKF